METKLTLTFDCNEDILDISDIAVIPNINDEIIIGDGEYYITRLQFFIDADSYEVVFTASPIAEEYSDDLFGDCECDSCDGD